jgi:hypothetical protein
MFAFSFLNTGTYRRTVSSYLVNKDKGTVPFKIRNSQIS